MIVMFGNSRLWADYFRSICIPDVDAYATCLTERLLPRLASLDTEATEVEQAEYDRLIGLGSYDDDFDPADLADKARDKAIAYMQTMGGIRQGLINMFGAGLYHLFEQQLLLYHRRAVLTKTQKSDPAFMKVTKVRDIMKTNGIDITHFKAWPRLDELRLLANVVKHADGPSCEKLRVRRPNLFQSPVSVEAGLPSVRGAVYQPLVGEGIYLNQPEFIRYVDDVKEFWSELSQKLIENDRKLGFETA